MTITLRVVLLIASVLNCIWIILRIRKAQAKIEDSVFWILFSGFLVCISIFPKIIDWGAAVTGVYTPVNFVFLAIIFVLIVKLFRLSIKMSQIESKLQTFVQAYAIDKLKMSEKEQSMKETDKTNKSSGGVSKSLIIIPAYNEQENIIRTIQDIEQNIPDANYIVINDCSSDNTKEILRSYRASYLDVPVNLGIGGGVQTGYRYAVEHDYDIAIQVDGDGQHDARYIKDLISPIENGQADVVIGSRFITNEGFQSSAMRRFGISFLSGLIYLLCGIKVKDVTSGMRAVNRKMMEEFSENYAQDYPEPEAILASGLMNARIQEVPVRMRERRGGTSSINALRSVYYMIKVSTALVMNRLTAGKEAEMISMKLKVAMLIAVGLYFMIVFQLLKRKTLNLKYTLLWLASGVIMLALAIFPQILTWFATLVGIYEPTNALFAFMFFCVIIILMSITAIVSKLNEKNKKLIQSVALLEKRVRELEDSYKA